MSRINEILPDLVGKTLDHSRSRMPGEVQMYKMYVEKAKLAILSDLLEIIGEDEIDNFPDIHEIAPRLRNQLRQELRAKVKEYCK